MPVTGLTIKTDAMGAWLGGKQRLGPIHPLRQYRQNPKTR